MLTLKKSLTETGRYVLLMGRTFTQPDRWRMFYKEYVKEMFQLGYNSIGIVLIISFFIGAVICLQIKLNIQSPWMPRMVTGYTTRDALDIMGVNSANYLILPKILGLMTIMPILVTLSVFSGMIGAYSTSFMGTTTISELTEGFRYEFNPWFFWCGMIKAVVYAFIISSVSAYKGYTVDGGSIEVGVSSTDAVVTSSVLILFADIFLTQILT